MDLSALNLTREEMYEKVWTEPVTAIARSYSVRDHEIISLCDKNNIPRPPTGYWSRLRHGYRIDRPPLPTSCVPSPKVAERSTEPKKKWAVRPAPPLPKIEPGQPIEITSPHPLITKTYHAYKSIHPDQTDRLRSKDEALAVWVGYRCLDRAMYFMDLLIKELEARGDSVSVKPSSFGERWETQAVINGERVPFHVEETTAKKPLPPSDFGPRLRNRNHEYVATSILSLVIDNYMGASRQPSWSDLKNRGIEQRIPEIILGMIEIAAKLKVTRLAEEKRLGQIRTGEEKRRKIEEEERLRKEQIAKVEPASLSWEKAERIRRFISALESATIGKFGQLEAENPIASFITLARGHADAIDPIIQTLKSMQGEQKS